MLIHQLPLDAAFATVRSVPTGLSQTVATARRLEFGPNRIERLAPTPLVVRLLRQFTHFFAALLWVAALLALVADWWMPGQGMAMLAAAIVAVIAINGAFSFWQEYTASGHAVFGTAPIRFEAWLVVLPFAVAMLALEEAQKAFIRWRERNTSGRVFQNDSCTST